MLGTNYDESREVPNRDSVFCVCVPFLPRGDSYRTADGNDGSFLHPTPWLTGL